VAVITSPTGAAIRDFLKVVHRRFANIEIIVVPVKVQGEEAASEMVNALETVNRKLDVDIIVLTRGGGSMEDLWAFNDEALALAIRASEVPVVSAVGHEIDLTISDLAADFRAPTPSAAAEILVAEKEALKEGLRGLGERIRLAMRSHLSHMRQQLTFLSKGLKDPRKAIEEAWLRLDDFHQRLHRATASGIKAFRERLLSEHRALLLNAPLRRMESSRQRLAFQQGSLSSSMNKRLKDLRAMVALNREKLVALNPLSVLKRGYSIARKLPGREVVRSAASVQRNDRLHVTLAEGDLECRIENLSMKRSPS
jgi:exodeoxyribonuclease VII large subunit